MLGKLLAIFMVTAIGSAAAHADEPTVAAAIDTGNTAWLLLSTALVMLMTPGLAFFYAGMVHRKNVVSTLLQNYVALAIVGLLWVTIGYSWAFSEGTPFIGGNIYFMLDGLDGKVYNSDIKIPEYAFMAFQMMFAVITPALITGAITDRIRFKAWMLLLALWSLFVYVPIAHWVWGPKGWLLGLGVLDFAGGLVVHTAAGVSALVAALMFGKRNTKYTPPAPNDVSMIMLGAALLWFGWFGFNAGSALTSGTLAAHAFVTTFVGAAAALLSWMLVDWIVSGKPSAVGASIGLVVGLVVITPAAGFVSVGYAMLMCAIGGAVCNIVARKIKKITHLNDTLDVFACHGVGGILGAIMTGLFASKAVNPSIATEGYLISGETAAFVASLTSVVVVCAYSMIATYILIKLVNIITPIRVSKDEEIQGLDAVTHGEEVRNPV